MKATVVASSVLLVQYSYSAFVLLHPPSELGISDGSLAPCDGQDIQTGRNSIDYPESGFSFRLRSNKTSATWKFQYNNDFQNNTWKSLLTLDALYQHGEVEFGRP